METKKFLLSEKDIPTQWYNIAADMINKPAVPLHPGTRKPLTAEDLSPIFAEELCRQELNFTDRFIEIPEEVRDVYRNYRPTPLVRAYGLEKALDTPAKVRGSIANIGRPNSCNSSSWGAGLPLTQVIIRSGLSANSASTSIRV